MDAERPSSMRALLILLETRREERGFWFSRDIELAAAALLRRAANLLHDHSDEAKAARWTLFCRLFAINPIERWTQ